MPVDMIKTRNIGQEQLEVSNDLEPTRSQKSMLESKVRVVVCFVCALTARKVPGRQKDVVQGQEGDQRAGPQGAVRIRACSMTLCAYSCAAF